MKLTHHAVERYRNRFAPDATFMEAQRELEELARRASPLKERTVNGTEQWRTPDGVILVVTRDYKDGPVCKTVLPKYEEENDQAHDPWHEDVDDALNSEILSRKIQLQREIATERATIKRCVEELRVANAIVSDAVEMRRRAAVANREANDRMHALSAELETLMKEAG